MSLGDVVSTLDARKVIARRAALELPSGGVVGLGSGLPDLVARVAREERVAGLATRAAPGGGLDCAFLDFTACDRFGNVDAGPGGVGGDLGAGARKVVFLGTFTTGGADLAVAEGRLRIGSDGRVPRLVAAVGRVTFAGPAAVRRGQEVLVVTERSVFRLTEEGLALAEVAPGVDLVRHVLRHLPFQPIMRRAGVMDPALFRAPPVGLRARLAGSGGERPPAPLVARTPTRGDYAGAPAYVAFR